jgi:hypothetical protein
MRRKRRSDEDNLDDVLPSWVERLDATEASAELRSSDYNDRRTISDIVGVLIWRSSQVGVSLERLPYAKAPGCGPAPASNQKPYLP